MKLIVKKFHFLEFSHKTLSKSGKNFKHFGPQSYDLYMGQPSKISIFQDICEKCTWIFKKKFKKNIFYIFLQEYSMFLRCKSLEDFILWLYYCCFLCTLLFLHEFHSACLCSFQATICGIIWYPIFLWQGLSVSKKYKNHKNLKTLGISTPGKRVSHRLTLQEIFTVSFQHSADLTNSSFGIRKKLELNSIQKIKWSVGKFWRMLKTCLTNC